MYHQISQGKFNKNLTKIMQGSKYIITRENVPRHVTNKQTKKSSTCTCACAILL